MIVEATNWEHSMSEDVATATVKITMSGKDFYHITEGTQPGKHTKESLLAAIMKELGL